MAGAPERPVTVLARLVQQKYSNAALAELRRVWREEALPSGEPQKRRHFLARCEASPQAECVPVGNEDEEDDLFGFVCKLALYAPQQWRGVLHLDGEDDAKSIGVAYDASSRLRRAGVEFYHRLLSGERKRKCIYEGALRGLDDLPVPHGACRMVAISDTHLLHEGLVLPQGEVLLHAGDLCYEESRSADADAFEEYRSKCGTTHGDALLSWLKEAKPALHGALEWLGSRGFKHTLLVGGNHDYVLEQLGAHAAEELCNAYGVTYLHTERQPLTLSLEHGNLRFWGTALSVTGKLSDKRAVRSGNGAFQLEEEEAMRLVERAAQELRGKVDVMLVHAPLANGMLLAKASAVDPVGKLVREVQPSLMVCGHAHRPKDPMAGAQAEVGGALCINAACLGVWNQLHGYPQVLDIEGQAAERGRPAKARRIE